VGREQDGMASRLQACAILAIKVGRSRGATRSVAVSPGRYGRHELNSRDRTIRVVAAPAGQRARGSAAWTKWLGGLGQHAADMDMPILSARLRSTPL